MPGQTGLGLRPAYYDDVLASAPPMDCFEIHPENYYSAGGTHHWLEKIRQDYPLLLHSVSLSPGSAECVPVEDIARLKALADRYQSYHISEHLAWSRLGQTYFHDLLPLPYTSESLETVCRNIQQIQEGVGVQILLENPTVYVRFQESMPETEFLTEICRRTGCGLLLDINNIYINSINHDLDADAYIKALPAECVGEIHLAGHQRQDGEMLEGSDRRLLIDSHDAAVASDVWSLYSRHIQCFPECPVIIERDSNFPPLDELLAEAEIARTIRARARSVGKPEIDSSRSCA
ncbi:MNIO family bufferin maturase [Endozoicomonadaceae bacterium StTr2]